VPGQGLVTCTVGLLAALDHVLTTQQQPGGPHHGADTVYGYWHAHVSTLSAEDRYDPDAELPAHILLGPLHSGPVQRLLQRGESARSSVTRPISRLPVAVRVIP